MISMYKNQMEMTNREAVRMRKKKKMRMRRRRKIIALIKKTAPGIATAVIVIAGATWLITRPLPDASVEAQVRFQAENGQWYTQSEYDQMCRERDEYQRQEQEEAEQLAASIQEYQEQYEKDQEAQWKAYMEQEHARQGITAVIRGVDLSESDTYMLKKIAMAEAEGEDTKGKALVMLVVLNRVRSEKFPDTVKGVITAKGAFTPMSNGRYDRVEPDDDCEAAFEMINEGWNESQDALYFERTSDEETWHTKHLKKLYAHGAHTFFTEKE